ncbi:MAG: glycosyltransferase, partial [Actinobacteria bacterium]|nr:glycosyltransferase [Actinomycetota bacterium]
MGSFVSVVPGDEGEDCVAAYDVICLSHLRWDFVWQRPQQLLTRFARDRRVIFVEEPVPGDGPSALDLSSREEGVVVAVPHLPRDLSPEQANTEQERLLQDLLGQLGIERYVLWLYTPMAVAFTRGLKPLAIVYDCMDELSAFAQAPPELRQLEDELFRTADLVFTGGVSLFEAKRDRHHDVHLFPSSVDTAHFAAARSAGPEPEDQAGISSPRLGYIGVIDERMDLGLLAAVAAAEPSWQLILIGPLAKIDPGDLPRRPNIHYLGQRPYAELPSYLHGWDVALLPFVRNESTRFISPTKTPEYLAAGLPVVSTPIADVVRPYGDEGLVGIAGDAAEFVERCREAMLEHSEERLRRVDAFLTENSWDFTWADMSEHLERVVRRGRSARESHPQW